MSSDIYLGIDLGTSGVKVVLLDDTLQCVGEAYSGLTVSNPKPLWSEQDPNDWWQALCLAINHLKITEKKKLANVRALGLAGQQHGAVLLNQQGEVLRPAMLWNDGRASAECALLCERVPHIEKRIGSWMMPGFTAPKVLWVQRYEPEIFSQISKIVLPKDYLRWRLSGTFATDMSDASGTGWFDISKRDWCVELLSATQLRLDQMPMLYEGNEICAFLSEELANLWGIPTNTPIVAGAGDNAASAIAANVMDVDRGLLSLGTSGVYFVSTDKPVINATAGVHTFAHCLPKRWHYMNCHLSAASCLTWFAQVTTQSVSTLLEEAEQAAFNRELLFLPYLSGERSPLNNPYASGQFFGIRHQVTRADLSRAILEGVALNFTQGQAALIKMGVCPSSLEVLGGGARNRFWGKILASCLGVRLRYRPGAELSVAVGAAKLAYLGYTGMLPEKLCKEDDKEVEEIDPVAEWVPLYQEKYRLFTQLYEQSLPLIKISSNVN